MKQQLAWLREHCPDQASVTGLAYPALCGAEVVTCDNTRYSTAHPDDKDRSGLVYSVPFFDAKGKLKGTLSGVILTHAFRDLLPAGGYVLRNKTSQYSAVPNMAGAWAKSLKWVEQDRSDPNLLYSELLPLNVTDATGGWELWAGQPNTSFYAPPEVHAARQFALIAETGLGILLLCTLGVLQ